MMEKTILNKIEGKKFTKTLWGPIGKAMHKYRMIESGDRVAVGISGGKDSLTVLNALVRIQKISQIDFEIIPVHVHPNTNKASYHTIKEYCAEIGLELFIIESDIESILFGEDEQVKNPCFLCGRLRRGMLYTFMKNKNINKLALGHHKDDIIETFLMNVFYQGNMNMMRPAYFSDEHKVTVIRPLAFVEEKDIVKYINSNKFPVIPSDCPYENSPNSKRLRVKKLINELSLENSNIRNVMLRSLIPLL